MKRDPYKRALAKVVDCCWGRITCKPRRAERKMVHRLARRQTNNPRNW